MKAIYRGMLVQCSGRPELFHYYSAILQAQKFEIKMLQLLRPSTILLSSQYRAMKWNTTSFHSKICMYVSFYIVSETPMLRNPRNHYFSFFSKNKIWHSSQKAVDSRRHFVFLVPWDLLAISLSFIEISSHVINNS